MELFTTNTDINLQHCFLRFDVNPDLFEEALQKFNDEMKLQLSAKGTQTPGKIMHTKVFNKSQIRCYFAYSSQTKIDWQQFVQDTITEDALTGPVKLIKLS